MFDIRVTGRNAVALLYSYLEMVQFNPAVAIVLTLATCVIRTKEAITFFYEYHNPTLCRTTYSRKMTHSSERSQRQTATLIRRIEDQTIESGGEADCRRFATSKPGSIFRRMKSWNSPS